MTKAGSGHHRRRVGTVRPSHLMFTGGVGGLVDLPNFSVIVRGLDDWSYDNAAVDEIVEPRLLAAVGALNGMRSVKQLRPAPWLDGIDSNPKGPAATVGVPVAPFPAWLRCTACNELAPAISPIFDFENVKPTRPHDARYSHTECERKRGGRRPLAVPARFMLACTDGHLDDFPYVKFVHAGDDCPKATHPRLQMVDHGGNVGASVEIRCKNCGAFRNISQAIGDRNVANLPNCRGRHAHLNTFETCDQPPRVLVVGASNQWFGKTLSALAVPRPGASELAIKVEKYWANLEGLPGKLVLPFARANVPALKEFTVWNDDELWAAIEAHRKSLAGEDEPAPASYPDLRTAEWEIFTASPPPDPTDDFTIRRADVPGFLAGQVTDVVQVERLREVRALVGFTRLDAPDPEDPELVTIAPLARTASPDWVPASEVRGEGLFLRVSEELLSDWEKRVADSAALNAHREAYAQFRRNRYSDRIHAEFDAMAHWPGPRYIALHTLSHLLIRTIALECGYNSASLSERIYAGNEDDPWAGILIYTAVPDAEGTLGGLVSLGEPREFSRIVRRALHDAQHCSSDPLCSERLPAKPADFLHGAACHVCLFVSETTCERGNRFLDRRFVVPLNGPADSALALLADLA